VNADADAAASNTTVAGVFGANERSLPTLDVDSVAGLSRTEQSCNRNVLETNGVGMTTRNRASTGVPVRETG
jgi:hypothetical protein